MAAHYDVAIIGAGFCGTITAVNLLRLAPSLSVVLIERNETHGAGLAYGTSDPDHLLNVRVGQMGAFADAPGDFRDWLQRQPGNNLTDIDFAPRSTYGNYLRETLMQCAAEHPNLVLLNAHIVKMHKGAQDFELTAKDGQKITASRVVLALGNFPPDQAANAQNIVSPYAPEVWRKLAEPGDVLIVGTGLTSLDLVVTLAKTKASGVIHLLSRHGLLPREHIAPQPYKLNWREPYPATALGLLRALRREIHAADVPWQAVVDALRPLNQILWQALTIKEKRRFLRHLRAYWDVHRHRCAPQIMRTYRDLEKQGRISLHHGSIIEQKPVARGWEVVWRPRGKSSVENLRVEHIVRCTGPQADFTRLDDALVQDLLKQGLIASDALRIGIATADYAACDQAGKPVDGLYGLGSLLKGKLYESVAVPELRVQAADVAAQIAKDFNA